MTNPAIVLPRQRSFGEEFGRQFGSGISSGVHDFIKIYSDIAKERAKQQNLVKAFTDLGIPPEEAKLYSKFTTGGQTEFAKMLLEQRKRGLPSERQRREEFQEEQRSPEEALKQEIEEATSEQDLGLTPAEKVKRQSERFKTGLPAYQEAGTKLRGFARDKERLDLLENINKSGKLPKNLARINVDKEGNLRLPFASTPEAQRYVKILNEFSSGAKDTFGSRVTNFDLSQYLKRFPTLLNSEEGRRQLLSQMKIVNDINSVHYKTLKDVYDRAGGVRGIDADRAEAIAESASADKISSLVKKFDEIGKLTSLPDASQFKGRKIKDTATGEVLVSDGEHWLPEG